MGEHAGRRREMLQERPPRVPVPAAGLFGPGAHLLLEAAAGPRQGADQCEEAERGVARATLRRRRLTGVEHLGVLWLWQRGLELVGQDEDFAAQWSCSREDAVQPTALGERFGGAGVLEVDEKAAELAGRLLRGCQDNAVILGQRFE